MSDFNDNLKHLDILPATECPDGLSPKRISRRPSVIHSNVRAIKKLKYQITIPATGLVPIAAGHNQAFIAIQYNYSATKEFRVAGLTSRFPPAQCVICIRYRIGTEVTRYYLGLENVLEAGPPSGPSGPNPLLPGATIFKAQHYTGQVIKPNFVIELWAFPLIRRLAEFFAIFEPIVLNTSLLINPSDVNQSSANLATGVMIKDELYHLLPEVIPTPYGTDSAWLTN